jgi:predicted acetyltransferase
MLQLSLAKCKELGIHRVLVTCNDDNEASRRTILKNDGTYESTVYEPNEGINLQRYWIDLSD